MRIIRGVRKIRHALERFERWLDKEAWRKFLKQKHEHGKLCRCLPCSAHRRFKSEAIKVKAFYLGAGINPVRTEVAHIQCGHLIVNYAHLWGAPNELYVACKVCETEKEWSAKANRLPFYNVGKYSGSTLRPATRQEQEEAEARLKQKSVIE